MKWNKFAKKQPSLKSFRIIKRGLPKFCRVTEKSHIGAGEICETCRCCCFCRRICFCAKTSATALLSPIESPDKRHSRKIRQNCFSDKMAVKGSLSSSIGQNTSTHNWPWSSKTRMKWCSSVLGSSRLRIMIRERPLGKTVLR